MPYTCSHVWRGERKGVAYRSWTRAVEGWSLSVPTFFPIWPENRSEPGKAIPSTILKIWWLRRLVFVLSVSFFFAYRHSKPDTYSNSHHSRAVVPASLHSRPSGEVITTYDWGSISKSSHLKENCMFKCRSSSLYVNFQSHWPQSFRSNDVTQYDVYFVMTS